MTIEIGPEVERALFDESVKRALEAITMANAQGILSSDEYPLALLLNFGMIIASQLKRQADELARTNEALAHILETLNGMDT